MAIISCDLLSIFEIMIFATTLSLTNHYPLSCDLLSIFEIMIFATTLGMVWLCIKVL